MRCDETTDIHISKGKSVVPKKKGETGSSRFNVVARDTVSKKRLFSRVVVSVHSSCEIVNRTNGGRAHEYLRNCPTVSIQLSLHANMDE